jgi:hypothetical protein
LLVSADGAAVLKVTPTSQLTISDAATGEIKTSVGPISSCRGPFTLQLLSNGLLALLDKKNMVIWSSTSACLGTNTNCYSCELQSDGRLVVLDGTSQRVWSSGDGWSSSTASALGWLHQLTSGGQPHASCMYAAPTQLASKLISMSKRYELQLAQSQAALQIYDTSTQAALWSAMDSSLGASPKQLCIGSSGVLALRGTGLAAIWSSGSSSASSGPYTALVTDDGCLEVLDGSCSLVYSSHSSSKQTVLHAARPPARTKGKVPVLGGQAGGASSASPASGATTSEPAKLAQLKPSKQLALGPGGLVRPPPTKKPQHTLKSPTGPRTQAASLIGKSGSGGKSGKPAAKVAVPTLSEHLALEPGRLVPPPPAKKPQHTLKSPPGPRTQAASLISKSGSGGKSGKPAARDALPTSFQQRSTGPGMQKVQLPQTPGQAGRGPGGLQAKACMLQQGALCGGINLCGQSAPCASAGCCMDGLTCTRASRYTWRCTS